MNTIKCPDCNADLALPEGVVEGELITCYGCGLELEYHQGKFRQLVIEGEDWGE